MTFRLMLDKPMSPTVDIAVGAIFDLDMSICTYDMPRFQALTRSPVE
jgi:hypothetical protein